MLAWASAGSNTFLPYFRSFYLDSIAFIEGERANMLFPVDYAQADGGVSPFCVTNEFCIIQTFFYPKCTEQLSV